MISLTLMANIGPLYKVDTHLIQELEIPKAFKVKNKNPQSILSKTFSKSSNVIVRDHGCCEPPIPWHLGPRICCPLYISTYHKFGLVGSNNGREVFLKSFG